MANLPENLTEEFVRSRVAVNHPLTRDVPNTLAADCPNHVGCKCGWVSHSCSVEEGTAEHKEHQDDMVERLMSNNKP